MEKIAGKIAVQNATSPGSVRNVDAAKYTAMRQAYLAAMPSDGGVLTLAEIRARLDPLLPEAEFPGGEKAGWWAKCVQLDLEAKGVLVRMGDSPVRLRMA